MKDNTQIIEEMCQRVNVSGCRVAIPQSAETPITVLFDGEFSNAEYLAMYPATLHIYGMAGHVSLSDIAHVERVSADKYILYCRNTETGTEVVITISNSGRA